MGYKDKLKQREYNREYHKQNKERVHKRKHYYNILNKTPEELKRIEERRLIKEKKELDYQEAMKNKTTPPPGKTYFTDKRSVNNLKNKFFVAYGDKCKECGESIRGLLTLDHINNNGILSGRHRHKEEYRRAVNHFDDKEFQILCFNCNMRKNRENLRKKGSKNQKTSERIHLKFFELYGNKCVCCGESVKDNLTMDHVKNNGKELRKKNGTGLAEYRVAIKVYDPETYQVLCWNCNLGKQTNKERICPHQKG